MMRTVAVFPIARRAGFEPETFGDLLRTMLREGRRADAAAFWQKKVSALRRTLERQGVPPEQAELAICAFRDAVKAELPEYQTTEPASRPALQVWNE